MSCNVQRESATAFAQSRSFAWRAFFHGAILGAIELVRTCRRRRQQRRELLDYMACEHRAAADIGITSYEARHWSQRPFWRP